MNTPRDAESLVPAAIASELTGASIDNIRQWLADGSIRSERIGKHLYVCLEDVERAARTRPEGNAR